MSKDTKTVFRGFDYQNCDDFAAYLKIMSSKGWHFKEWGAGLKFEKGEPSDVEYAVEVFIDGTEYDTRPEPHTQEFAEYCEAAGWKLLDAKRKFCIFKKISPDAVPILTHQERLDNTAKSIRGGIWYQVGLGACFTFMQWTDFFGTQFSYKIFSNQRLMITFVWTVLFLFAVLRCVQFYWWQHSTRKAIERGEGIYLGRKKGSFGFTGGWYSALTAVLMVVWMVSFLAAGEYNLLLYFSMTVFLLLAMGFVLSKLRPDPVTNQVIQLVFSFVTVFGGMFLCVWFVFSSDKTEATYDNIPLLYEDIGANAGVLEEANMKHSSSIFGSWTYCTLGYEEEYVGYTVYRSEYEWVLDRIWSDEAEWKYNQTGTDCTTDWDAIEAYRNSLGEYMVRYEDAIVTFKGDEEAELTPEQITVIRETLLER